MTTQYNGNSPHAAAVRHHMSTHSAGSLRSPLLSIIKDPWEKYNDDMSSKSFRPTIPTNIYTPAASPNNQSKQRSNCNYDNDNDNNDDNDNDDDDDDDDHGYSHGHHGDSRIHVDFELFDPDVPTKPITSKHTSSPSPSSSSSPSSHFKSDLSLSRAELKTMSKTANLLSVGDTSLNKAKHLYQRVLKAQGKVLGLQHQDTLITCNNYGALCYRLGDWDEALFLYERVLRGYEETEGKFEVNALTCLQNIAAIKYKIGDLEMCRSMYERVLNGFRNALGEEHPLTSSVLNNLGMCYRKLGDVTTATDMYVKALNGRCKELGPDHPDTMNTLNNLGTLFLAQNKLIDALNLYWRAYEGQCKLLGKMHIVCLSTLNQIACVYIKLDRVPEAKDLIEKVLVGRENTLGMNHRDTLCTVHNLASLLYLYGDLQRAEELNERAILGRLRILRKRDTFRDLGSLPLDYLCSVNNLGAVYFSQERFDEAKEKFIQVLNGRSKLLQDTHLDVLSSLYNVGLVLRRLQDPDADTYFEKALIMYEGVLGQDNAMAKMCRGAMLEGRG